MDQEKEKQNQSPNPFSPEGKYGISDTTDGTWMGNDKGPIRSDDLKLMMLGAAVINKQFRTHRRFIAAPIDPGPFKDKGTVTAEVTLKEAFAEIEKGIIP